MKRTLRVSFDLIVEDDPVLEGLPRDERGVRFTPDGEVAFGADDLDGDDVASWVADSMPDLLTDLLTNSDMCVRVIEARPA